LELVRPWKAITRSSGVFASRGSATTSSGRCAPSTLTASGAVLGGAASHPDERITGIAAVACACAAIDIISIETPAIRQRPHCHNTAKGRFFSSGPALEIALMAL
jgi:hypothetical protein